LRRFCSSSLGYIPVAALGAVLVMAALSLVDSRTLKTIYKLDRSEFALSVFATLGVVAVGAVHAIVIAVVLAILRFVRLMSRPAVEILGRVEGFPGFHSIARHPEATTTVGLLLLRFSAPIVFFNARYFKREVFAAANEAGSSLKWIVLDMLPITMVDTAGLYTVDEIANSLRERHVVLAAAGRQTEWHLWADARQRPSQDRKIPIYPTLKEACKAFGKADFSAMAKEVNIANS
jgi:MFS superfamily sulfate permease-like transporter